VWLGAYHAWDLVGVMGFARPRARSGDYWELVRFASALDYTFPGLFSKMEKHGINIIKQYGATRLVSFSDNMKSAGKVYKNNGYTVDEILNPDYFYSKNGKPKKIMKGNLQKRKCIEKHYDDLVKIFGNIDFMKLTETIMTDALGYYRCYDAGKIRWIKDISKV